RRLARRHAEHAWLVLEKVDAEVLLEERQAAIPARPQPQPLLLRVLGLRGVGVQTHAIAEPAAQHLPARHAPRLAGEVHHRHLDSAHAAALPRVPAELLDLPEDLVDVARVLAKETALEHQRVRLACAVAYFAPADDTLVGIDADDRTCHGRLDDDRDANVGDLERRRLRRAL